MQAGSNNQALEKGYKLHWYEIRSVIGRGGFGITYLAHDTNLDREVAIKEFMPKDFAIREGDSTVHPQTGEQGKLYEWGLEKFIAEARTLAKFNHPNIVRVLSVFSENNTAYMVMDFVHGKDLATVYQESPPFTETQFLDTFIPIMDGLILVHKVGFIHRDIKPANIYICENGTPLLLDFGSARQAMSGKNQALTSLVTLGYAPFEQYSEGSGQQGPWTDIYALGASIYVGITGHKPADALNRSISFMDKGIDTYQPVSLLQKGHYSENFLLSIDKALLLKIEDRPADIMEWADMLLGKTPAPPLPDYLLNPPEEDKTQIMPHHNPQSSTTGSSSRGTQGLIDTYGKRNTDSGASLRTSTPHTLNEQNQPPERKQEERHSPKAASSSHAKKAPIAIGLLISALVIIAVTATFLLNKPPSPETKNESQQKQQELEEKQQAIQALLNSANQALINNFYISPEKANANYYFQQILMLDPQNQHAQEGIHSLTTTLFNLAKTAYDKRAFSAAKKHLEELEQVQTNLPEAAALKEKVSQSLARLLLIETLISNAETQLKAKNYTSPQQNNALYWYNEVLKEQPENRQAKQGLKTLYNSLFSQANASFKKKQFEEAKDYLAQIELFEPNSPEVLSLKKGITQALMPTKARAKPIAKTPAKQTKAKKLSEELTNKTLEQFLRAIKPRDKKAMDKLSHYTSGRAEFVRQLFANYQRINVHISNFQFIAKTNQAQAQVELKNLIDINGQQVKPGNWNKFQIIIRLDNEGRAEIYW
jgi:serine/threonine protein kinase